MNYVVSDLHFNHSKLVQNCPNHFEHIRYYVDTDDMNSDIVNTWNKTITSEDTVYFLGDFLLNTPGSKKIEEFTKFYDELNFYKMNFVIGNHDEVLIKKLKNEIVDPKKFYRIDQLTDFITIPLNGRIYFMKHYPFNTLSSQNRDVICEMLEIYKNPVFVHGHTHSADRYSEFELDGKKYIQNNVSWESYYRPVNVEELVSGV